MHFLRLSTRIINLEYLIQMEDLDRGPPARVRLTLAAGFVLDVEGADADRVHSHMDKLAPPDGPASRGSTAGPRDPATGKPLRPPRDERK
jgi:hypothetical protein